LKAGTNNEKKQLVKTKLQTR